MDRCCARFGLRSLPWGLIGMLLVVGGFEVLVARGDRFSNDLAASWKYKGEAAVREAVGARVVCFGDSMIGFGVLPRVLEGRLLAPSYNLALHAGSSAASYVLLRRLLEAGGRPDAILVDFMPHQLAQGPGQADHRRTWPELATLREGAELAWSSGDPGFFASTLVSRCLATVRVRRELRASVLAAIGGRSWSARQAVRLLRRNWDANLGAQVMPASSRPNPVDPGPAMFTEAWAPDPTTLDYVRRFLRLAGDRGIDVYWVIPPIRPHPAVGAIPPALDAPYASLIANLQAEFPGLRVVDGRRARYEPSLFVDAIHLNRAGATALSAELAAILDRPEVEGEGWIELPDYRDHAVAVAVEDLDESRLALRSRARPAPSPDRLALGDLNREGRVSP